MTVIAAKASMSERTDRTLRLDTIPVLTDVTTYHKWKLAIENYLLVNGCLGITEGIDTEPYRRLTEVQDDVTVPIARNVRAGSVAPAATETTSHRELTTNESDKWDEWRKRELRTQGAIMSTVDTGLLVDLRTFKTAREMWIFLATDMQLMTSEHRTEVERKLRNIMLRSNATAEEMTAHLQSFNMLWLEALDSGCPFTDYNRADWFLDTLPVDFKVMRSLYINLPVLLKTWHELRRMFQTEVSDRARTATRPTQINALRLNTTDVRPKAKGDDWIKDAECHYCKKKGHLQKECRIRVRDEQRKKKPFVVRKQANNTEAQPKGDSFWASTVNLMSTTQINSVDGTTNPMFLLDSGATHHLTPSRTIMSNLVKLDPPVRFGLADSNAQMVAYEKGDIILKLPSGQGIQIMEVYLIPCARQNILSVGLLQQRGWTIDFVKRILRRGNEVVRMKDDGVLNYIQLGTVINLGTISSIEAMGPLQLEHNRLGHISRKKILELARLGELRCSHDVLEKDEYRTGDCTTCQERKAAKQPKNGISPHGTHDCEMIHSDISGPLEPSSNGARYITTMYDDYSKVNRVVTTSDRKWTLAYLQEFVTKIERQLGSKVRFLRSDGGGEYLSEQAKSWYSKTGIIHQISPRYTPELNGTAERFNRTLKEMAASMLSTASLDHAFWDHAVRYASVMMMKTSSNPEGVNAWFNLTGRTPNLSKSFMFGEFVYVQIPSETRTKSRLDFDKGELARVLGQEEGMSGWVVRFERTGQFVVSRDVKSASNATTPLRPLSPPLPPVLTPTVVRPAQPPIPEPLPAPQPVPQRTEEPLQEEEPVRPQTPVLIEPETLISPAPVVQARQSRRLKEKGENRGSMDETVSHTAWYGDSARQAYLASEVAIILAVGDSTNTPNTVHDALSSPESKHWEEAMIKELANIELKDTWEETTLPHGRKPIDSRWVFAIKLDADGRILKYKARLVAKGFSQQPGVDYEETYAPVGRVASLRLLLTIAAAFGLELHQADVEGAYLNGRLEEEIYMRYPDAVVRSPGCNVLRLKGSLYGLKQSARVWWTELGDVLAYGSNQIGECTISRPRRNTVRLSFLHMWTISSLQQRSALRSHA